MSAPSSLFIPTGVGQDPDAMVRAAIATVISRHQNLWVATQEDGRWGIRQRSY